MEQSSQGSFVDDFGNMEGLIPMADTPSIVVEERIQALMKEIPSQENPLEDPFLLLPQNDEISRSANLVEKRLGNLEADVSSIQTTLAAMAQSLRESEKARRIEFALANPELSTPRYLQNDIIGDRSTDYTNFVVETLLCFRKGDGKCVPKHLRGRFGPQNPGLGHPDFRTVLLDRLDGLLGSRPRMENDGEGNATIFYD